MGPGAAGNPAEGPAGEGENQPLAGLSPSPSPHHGENPQNVENVVENPIFMV